MYLSKFSLLKRPLFFFLASLSLFVLPCIADVRLPNIISDDMVLQRDKPIQIWGWADAGEKVTVKPSWQWFRGSSATADANGKWKVQLPAAKAGGLGD